MYIEFIEKEHPDLPEDFAVVVADNFFDAFSEMVRVLNESEKLQLVVWNGADCLFSSEQREVIESFSKKIQPYAQTELRIDSRSGQSFQYDNVNRCFSEYFNSMSNEYARSGVDNMHEIQEVITQSWGDLIKVMSNFSSIMSIMREDKFVPAALKPVFHDDGLKHAQTLRFLRTFSGAGTIFVPEQDIQRIDNQSQHNLSPGVNRLWMMKQWALALSPATSKGGIVHTWPSCHLNSNLINAEDDRHMEVVDISLSEQLYNIR